MATSSSNTMATPTAAPATRLRRLSRDAARANKSSSLLGAMAAEARGSPRTRVPVRISRRLCSTTLPQLILPVPQTSGQDGGLPRGLGQGQPLRVQNL